VVEAVPVVTATILLLLLLLLLQTIIILQSTTVPQEKTCVPVEALFPLLHHQDSNPMPMQPTALEWRLRKWHKSVAVARPALSISPLSWAPGWQSPWTTRHRRTPLGITNCNKDIVIISSTNYSNTQMHITTNNNSLLCEPVAAVRATTYEIPVLPGNRVMRHLV